MDLIKMKIKEANGKIDVGYEKGKFCEFNVTLFLKKPPEKRKSRTKRAELASV